MRVAVRVEALKLSRSPVGVIATAALVGGTLALLGGMTAGMAAGNAELIAKAGPGATLDWSGLVAFAAQITSAGGLLGFGVVLAWMFAREFADGTITGLYALPVSRHRIALAKLVVYLLWAVATTVLQALLLLPLGLLLGYGAPEAEDCRGLARQLGLGVLTAAAATPVAWVATLTRSLLAGVGCAVGLVVVAQVGVLAGIGGWMPLAAPALWAMSGGTAAGPPQLGVTVLMALVFVTLTGVAWARLDLRR